MTEADARALLSQVDEVIIARGKATRVAKAKDVTVDELRGPTGNLRAPMVRVGRRLLVGFHDQTLRELLAAT